MGDLKKNNKWINNKVLYENILLLLYVILYCVVNVHFLVQYDVHKVEFSNLFGRCEVGVEYRTTDQFQINKSTIGWGI